MKKNKLEPKDGLVFNDLSKEIVLTHVATLGRLLEIGRESDEGIDAFLLYNFYCWVSAWQNTISVKAVSGFCMKGLKMSRKRFLAAKKILLNEKIVEDVIRRSKDGSRIVGHYIKIHYITRNPENLMKIMTQEEADR